MGIKRRQTLVWAKTGGCCWYCGAGVTLPGTNADGMTIDHVDPLGGDDLENLVPACRTCNCRKGKRPVEHLRELMGPIRFTKAQLDFLRAQGMIPNIPQFVFYFEREGMTA